MCYKWFYWWTTSWFLMLIKLFSKFWIFTSNIIWPVFSYLFKMFKKIFHPFIMEKFRYKNSPDLITEKNQFWCCGVVVITTAQLHSTKPGLRFWAGSNPARGVLEICNGADLWQCSQLKIRLNTFIRSTIPQKQFFIIIIIIVVIIIIIN